MEMEKNQPVRLVATDLDGTFLKKDNSVSPENLDALQMLGQQKVVRAIATGRNYVKTREVISPEIPFDYIVFSSGAGVYDCKAGKLVYHQNMDRKLTRAINDFLIARDLNFHLFRAVPENYRCWFHRGSKPCSEFESYLHAHRPHSEPLPANPRIDSESCQFLVVFPNQLDEFLRFKQEVERTFDGIKVVRTSSPLETGYIWMEIFHEAVSKGNGVRFICDSLGIDPRQTLGIGNDFNDLDLLEFTGYSYVVDNSPEELKLRFTNTCSNEESAFSKAVYNHFLK
jgi:Cof subfamily protein (haloacid dehalogenase superfamily)